MIDLNEKGKIPLGVKLSYSVGAFGENIAFNFYYLFFIFFLTNYAGISPAVAGTISLCSVACAITDPIVGYLSDRSKNPKGRRRPFILRFSIPLGIMIVLLFTNVGFSDPVKVVYFVLINFVFWVAFSLTDIPYLVLGGELTSIPEERISIRAMSSSFNYLSYAVAGYALFFVFKFEKMLGSSDKAWTGTAILFGIFVTGTFLLSYFTTKGREPVNVQPDTEDSINIFVSIKSALQIKPYRRILTYTIFFMTGIMVYTSNQVYLFMYNLGADATQTSNIYLGYAIMVIFLSPLVGKIGQKIGSKNTLIASIVFVAFGFGIYKFIPLTMYTVWGILFVCGIGVAGFFVISYAMVYDIADLAELKTDVNNEGVMVSFFAFVIKAATAIAMWIVGLLLSFYNYNAGGDISFAVMEGIKNIGTIIPACLCGISLIFILLYSLNTENLKTLRQLKEDKRNGVKIDQSIVEKLL